jgi:hypothetical protein
VRLSVAYRVCDPRRPEFVLTLDSGAHRDQSDANRTSGAIVEAFVPLAARLAQASGAVTLAPEENPCGQTAAKQTQPGPANGTVNPGAPGRAIYIGFTGAISGAGVNVLLLVDERDHAAFAPMRAEALVKGRFVPILADDATRAVGELCIQFGCQSQYRPRGSG